LKRSMLLGMLALALPTAGCATFSHLIDPASAPARQTEAKSSLPANVPPDATGDVETFLAQAMEARVAGDAAGAARTLSQLVLLAPDDPRVLGEYGKALTAEGRSDDALAFLQRAIQLQPQDWTLYSAQGVAYDQQSKFIAAQASYSRALQLKPGEAAALNNDALSHIQAGDLKGAEDLVAQVLPQSPGYPRIAKTAALLDTLKMKANSTPAPVEQQAHSEVERPLLPPPALVAEPGPKKQEVALVAPPPVTMDLPRIPAPEPMKLANPEGAPAKAPLLTRLEQLKADPTVMMAPIPADLPPAPPARLAAPASKPRAVEAKATVVATLVSGEKNDSAAAPAPAAKVYVQAGAYLTEARAKQAATGLESLDVKIMEAMVNGRDIFRVRIGPFATMTEAKSAYAQAQSLGRSDLIIVRE
jgi:Flp pilus assembly protein TadD